MAEPGTGDDNYTTKHKDLSMFGIATTLSLLFWFDPPPCFFWKPACFNVVEIGISWAGRELPHITTQIVAIWFIALVNFPHCLACLYDTYYLNGYRSAGVPATTWLELAIFKLNCHLRDLLMVAEIHSHPLQHMPVQLMHQ